MAITVTIAGENRNNWIKFGSLSITDNINQGIDTCEFTVEKYGTYLYVPELGEEIIVDIDGVRSFAGVILTVDRSIGLNNVITHKVTCKDWVQYLNRRLAIKRYENTDVQAIVLDLIAEYAAVDGFTGAAVMGADFAVKSISFNEITLSQAFEKLASLTGYSWYVDYYKDVHFFKKNDEMAPFPIGDDEGNHIYNTLRVRTDFSQVVNKIKIRGSEVRGDVRTKKLAGNSLTDQFSTDYKFAELPTVTVGGVAKTVGLEGLNQDIDFQVMWSYQQKYIRFTAGNIPPAVADFDETNIEIVGIPLNPLVVSRAIQSSVTAYGPYELSIRNDNLKTRDEALQYGLATLKARSQAANEGGFSTNRPGLRSGQTISIVSDLFAINENFLIQSVKMTQITVDMCMWTVTLATLRTIDLLDILQGLLQTEQIESGEDETLLDTLEFSDNFSMTDSIVDIIPTTSEDYVWEQAVPGSDTYPNPIVWDKFTWA